MSAMIETLSLLSSLHDEGRSENYIEPHYKEWYRVAIDALIEGGIGAYQEFLQKERATEFLAEEEVNYITNHIQKPSENSENAYGDLSDDTSSSGTYWPVESDVEAPNLDLGWPYVSPGLIGATDINLYFHPPKGHILTIKELVRKMIKEARQVIAIVMDTFTDVDIFKELVEASSRGVPVYLLLDDINFPHFLKMTEKQGVQLQRLRNMRVRTVKGQDYLSKSGAKFCGKMEQKFVLVDCEKVMYGTYSFMWSYEKVHLSMAQVITGKLVESFDEEFRTLYARSSIPLAFGQEESVIVNHKKIPWENGSYQSSRTSLISASSQRSLLGRQDQMHTLDSTYLKSRNRFAKQEDDQYGMRNLSYRPHHQLGFNVQNKVQNFQQFERNDNWKRHSYAAGDASPYLMLNRAVNNRVNSNTPSFNWQRQTDVGSVGSLSRGGQSSNYNGSLQSFANRLSRRVPNVSERNSSVRSSFHGTDSHIRSMQQRMPTLEHTTKSFLRNWRIESYLNDYSDIPPDSVEAPGDRYDVNEGSENVIENSLYSLSRLRTSLVYKPTLTEQKETNSTTSSTHSNSTIVDSQGSLTPVSSSPYNGRFSEANNANNFPSYDSKQLSQQDSLKRHSLQIPEGSQQGLNYSINRGQSNYLYSTLRTNRPLDNARKVQNDSILKRRSLPLFENRKVNAGQNNCIIPPNYIYNSLVKKQVETPAHQTASNCNGNPTVDITFSSASPNVNNSLQDSVVTNTVSVESLDEAYQEDNCKDSSTKKENKGSPSFLKKGSKKLKSLLNLAPDKKENLSKNKAPAFYRMCSSSDTLISEDDNQSTKKSDSKNGSSPRREKSFLSISQSSLHKSKENVGLSPSKSIKSTSGEVNKISTSPTLSIVENKFLENTGDASAPRFNTEQIQYQDTKPYVQNVQHGRTMSPAILHGELNLRPAQREAPQREMQHSEMPPTLQREMHLRHSLHRDMQQKELLRRDLQIQPKPEYSKPQEDVNHSRINERRVYSRFEPFSKLEHTMPSATVQNTSTRVSDFKSIGNSYNRPNNNTSYNPQMYNTMQHNENRFGRFMQKFGNFIHKKQ
ncbi:protein FAM83B [Bombina bombina]|uniref:protein FAM83B n=1 Tax=Bombina bombina TaxID=8345 RepID=UPI00235ADB76|nr:protein FAM83B [Bombina bombina]